MGGAQELGNGVRGIRAQTAGEHQLASIHDLPVLRGQRIASNAGEANFATRFYDQVRLGYSLFQRLARPYHKLKVYRRWQLLTNRSNRWQNEKRNRNAIPLSAFLPARSF